MRFSTKTKLAIGGLTSLHLVITIFLNAALYAHALSDVYQPDKTIPLPLAVQMASTFVEFPLVHLARLIPYSPASESASSVAWLYMLAYLSNSLLWAIAICALWKFATRSRLLHRGRD